MYDSSGRSFAQTLDHVPVGGDRAAEGGGQGARLVASLLGLCPRAKCRATHRYALVEQS